MFLLKINVFWVLFFFKNDTFRDKIFRFLDTFRDKFFRLLDTRPAVASTGSATARLARLQTGASAFPPQGGQGGGKASPPP